MTANPPEKADRKNRRNGSPMRHRIALIGTGNEQWNTAEAKTGRAVLIIEDPNQEGPNIPTRKWSEVIPRKARKSGVRVAPTFANKGLRATGCRVDPRDLAGPKWHRLGREDLEVRRGWKIADADNLSVRRGLRKAVIQE